jgi:aryl-alcohol dehydrogenase-like predicted oxidoreductase
MIFGQIPGIDKPVSRLVQGTVPLSSKDPDASRALLDGVFALGCNTFDTAHVYGGGDQERLLGRWIEERGIREEVVILAKGCHHNQDRRRVTPFDIAVDLHDSLARMQLEYVDLYVLHRDDPDVPVGPIVEALNEHVRTGRIRAFGGSNWSHQRIAEANAFASGHGLIPFACSSPNFSLAVQIKEPWPGCISIGGRQGETARNWYTESNTPLFCWSSLAGGFFSGRFTRDNLETFDSYFDKLCVECYCSEENFQRLDRIRELTTSKSATVTQIAMAWVMSQPLNIFALVGCANADEFRANAEALEINLTPQELDYLDLRSDSAA